MYRFTVNEMGTVSFTPLQAQALSEYSNSKVCYICNISDSRGHTRSCTDVAWNTFNPDIVRIFSPHYRDHLFKLAGSWIGKVKK